MDTILCSKLQTSVGFQQSSDFLFFFRVVIFTPHIVTHYCSDSQVWLHIVIIWKFCLFIKIVYVDGV